MKKTYDVILTVTAQFITTIEAEEGDDIEELATYKLGETNWNDLENMHVTDADIYPQA